MQSMLKSPERLVLYIPSLPPMESLDISAKATNFAVVSALCDLTYLHYFLLCLLITPWQFIKWTLEVYNSQYNLQNPLSEDLEANRLALQHSFLKGWSEASRVLKFIAILFTIIRIPSLFLVMHFKRETSFFEAVNICFTELTRDTIRVPFILLIILVCPWRILQTIEIFHAPLFIRSQNYDLGSLLELLQELPEDYLNVFFMIPLALSIYRAPRVFRLVYALLLQDARRVISLFQESSSAPNNSDDIDGKDVRSLLWLELKDLAVEACLALGVLVIAAFISRVIPTVRRLRSRQKYLKQKRTNDEMLKKHHESLFTPKKSLDDKLRLESLPPNILRLISSFNDREEVNNLRQVDSNFRFVIPQPVKESNKLRAQFPEYKLTYSDILLEEMGHSLTNLTLAPILPFRLLGIGLLECMNYLTIENGQQLRPNVPIKITKFTHFTINKVSFPRVNMTYAPLAMKRCPPFDNFIRSNHKFIASCPELSLLFLLAKALLIGFSYFNYYVCYPVFWLYKVRSNLPTHDNFNIVLVVDQLWYAYRVRGQSCM